MQVALRRFFKSVRQGLSRASPSGQVASAIINAFVLRPEIDGVDAFHADNLAQNWPLSTYFSSFLDFQLSGLALL